MLEDRLGDSRHQLHSCAVCKAPEFREGEMGNVRGRDSLGSGGEVDHGRDQIRVLAPVKLCS